jgi:RNA polymerase sigma-70 factor, ECF subfamily
LKRTGEIGSRNAPGPAIPRAVLSASLEPAAIQTQGVDGADAPSFAEVYEQCFGLAWRNIRRLGVPDAEVDDAVQEVFMIVHRRLGEFQGRAALRTWVCAIVTRVASDHRRTLRRKSPHAGGSVDADTLPDERARDPHDSAVREESVRRLHRLLDALDDDKREVFVLAELEQMSGPEIAETLGENVNTISARLRAARREFELLVSREQARDEWRLR